MRKILVLIYVCLLFTELAFAQERAINIPKSIGKLDSVSTAEEVEAIISSVDKRYAKFRVNTTLSFEQTNCFRLTDLRKITAVSKADFDKNGFTDLLVIGMWDRSPTILAVMGSSDDNVSVHVITNRSFRRCSIAKIILKDGNTLIEHRFFKTYNAYAPESAMVDSVNLVFRFGGFVEYNPSPNKYNIEQIEYNGDGGAWSTGSAFSIIVNTTRIATYHDERFDSFRGRFMNTYNGVLTDSIYNEITGLLNYSDFPNLKDRYAVSWTDDQGARLKITYNGGKVKIISDYGMLGTFGLTRIYQMITSVRASVAWTAAPIKGLVPLPRITN